MHMIEDLQELAEEKSLEVISTTSGSNGDPENILEAIIGFETFAEAEKLAEENNLEIIELYKKDGWQFWLRKGIVFEEIAVSSEFAPDLERFKDAISECNNFEDIKDMVSNYEKTLKAKTMHLSYDSQQRIIGVVIKYKYLYFQFLKSGIKMKLGKNTEQC